MSRQQTSSDFSLMMSNTDGIKIHDVVVVGAGPAGVGVGVALKDAGVEDYILVDRYGVGGSFDRWPKETRFITPSFPTNSIGMLDLNSIAIGASPAYSLEVEHPTGAQYAAHLRAAVKFFDLPVRSDVDVIRVTPHAELFLVDTPEETIYCKHLIWAAGEFQYPRFQPFEGAEICQHTATVTSYRDLAGDDFIIVGGYESGVDAAYHLAAKGSRVRLIDSGRPWRAETSDPSVALSTFSLERMREKHFKDNVELVPDTKIRSASRTDDGYALHAHDERVFETRTTPLLASGFVGGIRLVHDLFEPRDDGFPLLNENDESTTHPWLFLCGPAVR
ncbi:MAG: NAD(P)/FAD-dependent oxidoreductase, partial [Planctomycetota bacterium]